MNDSTSLITSKLLLITALALAGCTNEDISKSLASGAIGCPINAIAITEETATIEGLHNFTATCAGVDNYCSYMYPNPINCKFHTGDKFKRVAEVDDDE
jgi:hypothetical protein